MNRSIYLSPSTQENNIGIKCYGTEEYRTNLIADMVQKVLEENSITVYRNKPEWSLKKVVEDSNNKKPDIHLALHTNASNGTSRGCEVFCHRFGGKGHELAKIIYSKLEGITPTNDRGIKEGFNFYGTGKHMYELANTKAPAVLVEIAFHDNQEDAMWIINNMEDISVAISKAILEYWVSGEEISAINEAIQILKEKGIINTPDYWRQNAVKGKTVCGEYAAILIIKVADLLNEKDI